MRLPYFWVTLGRKIIFCLCCVKENEAGQNTRLSSRSCGTKAGEAFPRTSACGLFLRRRIKLQGRLHYATNTTWRIKGRPDTQRKDGLPPETQARNYLEPRGSDAR